MGEQMTREQCEKIITDKVKNPKSKCEGCVLITVALRLLELLDEKKEVRSNP